MFRFDDFFSCGVDLWRRKLISRQDTRGLNGGHFGPSPVRPEVAINGTHLGGRLNSGERLAGTLDGEDGVFGLDGEGVGFFCVCR